MTKNFVYFLLFLSTFFFYILGCAPQGSGILGSNSTLGDVVDSKIQNAPFAYDAVIDTISYNSCVSETVNRSEKIHGLMVSAAEGFSNPTLATVKSGIKLRTDFLQYVGKNFSPEYPNTVIKPSQIQKILGGSDYNKDAFLQIAVRRASDYAAVPDLIFPGLNNTKVNARAGLDLTVFPKELYSGFLGYQLTKNIKYTSGGNVLDEGTRVNNLSDQSTPTNIEAIFKLNATADDSYVKPAVPVGVTEFFGLAESYPEQVRGRFNSRANLLTVTFGGDQNIPDGNLAGPGQVTNHINLIKRPKLASSQSSDKTKAFGRGYQLTFESPTTNASLAGWLKTRLARVAELNLETGVPVVDTSWSCESFVIMQQNLWDNNRMFSSDWLQKDTMVEPSCSPLVASDLTGPSGALRQAQIKRIRRQYKAEYWNIGLYLPEARRDTYTLPLRSVMPICLVPTSPTTNECYLPTKGILESDSTKVVDVGVQYDITKECYLTRDGGGDAKRNLGRCAQFASVCVRSSSN